LRSRGGEKERQIQRKKRTEKEMKTQGGEKKRENKDKSEKKTKIFGD
jgi:hypothetical protein